MRTRRIVGLPLFLFAFLFVSAASSRAIAQQGTVAHGTGAKESIISATGTARVERTPDYVDIAVGVVANEKTAAEAQTSAGKVMEAAIAAINALQLGGSELRTGSVQLSPRYEQRQYSQDTSKIIGYSATIILRTRTTDIQSVAKVIDAALGAGCNRVDSVEFGIKEALAAREEAIKLATKAAKRKAQVMAEALDLHLARVVEATTSSHQVSGWYGANRISLSNVAQASGGNEGASGDEEHSPVVPGKIEIWVDATLTFTAAPDNSDGK